jgi:hypothetical protein
MNGIEVAGIGNIEKDFASGMQYAGIFNAVGGPVNGIQIAGFMNTAVSTQGIQGAGFMNITNEAKGFQGSGFMNIADQSKGFQGSGFLNLSGDAKGAQAAGFLNIADRIDGVQLAGFLNIADRVKGMQLGFINICDSLESGLPIGFLSFVKNGYKALEISFSETWNAQLIYRTGVDRFYTQVALASQFLNGELFWGAGFGLGTRFRLGNYLTGSVDLLSYQVMHDKWYSEHLNSLSQARITVEGKIAGKLNWFAGPTFNILWVPFEYPEPAVIDHFVPWTVYESTSGISYVRMWPGVSAGVRF